MPSRLVTGAIVAFWLAMTGWLIHKEVVPMMLAEASPAFLPDLTDEIGAPLIAWTIKRGNKRAGSATSRIVAKEDRSYEFHTTFHFDQTFISVKQIESVDHVTEEGKLQDLKIKISFEGGRIVEIEGEVVDKVMKPRVIFDGVENKFFEGSKIDMTEQGNTKTMSLVGKLRGLSEGQTWKVATFDPFRGLKIPMGGELIKQVAPPSSLIATVVLDNLRWDGKDVPCFKIEYHESGKEVTARTWVRKRDGMVLQQESSHMGFEMTLERVP